MATELKRSESMDRIAELLGQDASKLLDHTSQTILKDQLHLPGPDFVDRVWGISDRRAGVLRSLQTLFDNGRLAGTGYLSILPVDQGIEHPRTSSSSLSKVAATRSLRRSACSAQSAENTRTKFRSS
jgi:class I fructose-bisphosphate aldolase